MTNIAIGQDSVMTISTFFLDKSVQLPQYEHRTELDDSHWLHHTLMQGAARMSAASAKRPWIRPPQDALCSSLRQTIPKLACRTTWEARLAS